MMAGIESPALSIIQPEKKSMLLSEKISSMLLSEKRMFLFGSCSILRLGPPAAPLLSPTLPLISIPLWLEGMKWHKYKYNGIHRR